MQGLLEHTRKELEDQRKRAAMWQDECNTILTKYGTDDQKALQEARALSESLQKEVESLRRASEQWNKERAQLQKVPHAHLLLCVVPSRPCIGYLPCCIPSVVSDPVLADHVHALSFLLRRRTEGSSNTQPVSCSHHHGLLPPALQELLAPESVHSGFVRPCQTCLYRLRLLCFASCGHCTNMDRSSCAGTVCLQPDLARCSSQSSRAGMPGLLGLGGEGTLRWLMHGH